MKIHGSQGMAENAVGFTLCCGFVMFSEKCLSPTILLLCLEMYYTIFVIGYMINFYKLLDDANPDKKAIISCLPPAVAFSSIFIYYIGMFQLMQDSYCESTFLNFVIKGSAYLMIILCDILIFSTFCLMVIMSIQGAVSGVNFKFSAVFIFTAFGNILIFGFSLRYSLDSMISFNKQIISTVFEALSAFASIIGGLSICLTLFYWFIERHQINEHTNSRSKEYESLKNFFTLGLASEALTISCITWNEMISTKEEGSMPLRLSSGKKNSHKLYLMLSVSIIQLLLLATLLSRMFFIRKDVKKEQEAFSGSFWIKMETCNSKIGLEKLEFSVCCEYDRKGKPVRKKFTLPEECCICLGHYQNNEHVMVLQCGHVLHSSCYEYLLSSGDKVNLRCPLCRKIIKELC